MNLMTNLGENDQEKYLLLSSVEVNTVPDGHTIMMPEKGRYQAKIYHSEVTGMWTASVDTEEVFKARNYCHCSNQKWKGF